MHIKSRNGTSFRKQKLKTRLLTILSFPQVWLFLIILLLTVASLIAALKLKDKTWSSLCSNIFAGLVTGMVLALLSGLKQIYLATLEERLKWLQELRELLRKYLPLRQQLFSKEYDGKDREDFIYDILCIGNVPYEYIGFRMENKKIGFDPIDYCMTTYGIDIFTYRRHSAELHDWLSSNFYPEDNRTVWKQFEQFDSDLRQLYHSVSNDIDRKEIRIATARRSVI